MKTAKQLRPETLPILGCVFACIYWFIDSAIDTFIFQSKRLYIEDLLRPDSVELLARTQVVVLMMALSLVAMFLLKKQQEITARLERSTEQLIAHKDELEDTIKDRTNALRIKNIILQKEIKDRIKIEAKLFQLATIDPLTSIYNRRKFNEEFQSEINRNHRYHNELSLIIFDIDNFKYINDKHGHHSGDEILREFTHLISENIRKTDIFARWGGDEFVLLLPETTLLTAIRSAEKLRLLTEKFRFSGVGRLTASFGATHFMKGDNEATFLNRADDALYIAKEAGRNIVRALPPTQIKLSTIPASSNPTE